MGKIPEHLIEEIRNKTSITDVISQYVKLTPKGGRLWGLCPFHSEKTPSFTVNEDKGFYHCFGCGKGGSVFNFLMDIENLNFIESVERLADKAGVVLKQENDEDRRERNETKAIFELYRKLADMFHYILLHKPEARAALAYLERRKISPDMMKRYKIGYAPANPDWLYSFLKSKKYSDDILGKSGIFSKNNNPRFPLFVNRIMFPITDYRGEVLAFGGRSMDAENKAKYINSPETAMFKKRQHLFGLHEAIQSVRKENCLIICEGYFDVIALAQSGVPNAAAPLGTAFTDEQANRIRRYTDSCLLFFDGDNAGREAARKAIITLERAGIHSMVVIADEGTDPADCLQNHSGDYLKDIVKNRINGFNYLVKIALNKYDIALPDGKLSVFEEVKPYIEVIDSEIKKQSTIKMLSDVLGIGEDTILVELGKNGSAASYRSPANNRGSAIKDGNRLDHSETRLPDEKETTIGDISFSRLSADLFLMLTVVNNRQYFLTVRQSVPIHQLEDPYAIEIYTALEECLRNGETTAEYLIERLDGDYIKNIVISSLGMDDFREEDAHFVIKEGIGAVQLRALKKKQKHIEQKIKASAASGINDIELNDLLYEKKFIDEEIKKLRKS